MAWEMRKKRMTTMTFDELLEKVRGLAAKADAAALWCGGSRENVGRCCRDNHAQRVNKHDWSKGRKKGSGHINTDHRYMGIRFYFEADFQIYQSKIVNQ